MFSDRWAGRSQIAIGATDLFVDLVILLLPVPVIESLHLSRKRKMAVMGMFWLGAL